jgi:20S proteasome subunit alpha 4
MTRHIAGIQQKYTQSGGVRPFGISTLVAGLGTDATPALHQTDPSGTHSRWSAAAIGRNAKTVREFLEKEYEKAMGKGESPAKLAVRALMEAVEAGSATVELAELRAPPPAPATPGGDATAPPPTTDPPRAVLRFLTAEEVDALVAEVEADKAAAEAARKAGGGGGGGGGEGGGAGQ